MRTRRLAAVLLALASCERAGKQPEEKRVEAKPDAARPATA